VAGGEERILKRRIKSVQSTMKITRAMELIAASRIKRAEDRVRAAVPYSEAITEAVRDLSAAGGEVQSPLLAGREEERTVAVIAVTADRGLCGGYNSAVLRAAEGEIKEHVLAGRDYQLFCVGRKAESYFRFRGYKVTASFTGFTDQPSYEDARRIARAVEAPFIEGDVDRVSIIYTRFVTAGTQEVVGRPVAPLEQEVLQGGDARPGTEGTAATYEFEPTPGAILEQLLPRYVEARIYAALLNAAASEHAARQRAMKAATDNAEDLEVSLSRLANRARQEAITTEIMEIVGGAEALRTGGHHTGADQLLPAEMAAIGASSAS
jgi:F-type H+-transporting ATPase subunit gamma